MPETAPLIRIPLEVRPTVVRVGIGVHGVHHAVDRYRLARLWCLHRYEYAADLVVDGVLLHIQPGTVGVLPPDASVEYRYRGRSAHTYAHFTLPDAGNSVSGASVPLLQRLPDDDDTRFHADFAEAVGFFGRYPRRCEARLWDLLWRLTLPPTPETEERKHPAVRRALRLVEERLSEPLRVGELAVELDVSPGYLSRLFHAAIGTTLIAYLRERRMENARHLLLYSTLPITAIARQVGIPDLGQFNKAVHRAYGVSPRQLRKHRRNPHPAGRPRLIFKGHKM